MKSKAQRRILAAIFIIAFIGVASRCYVNFVAAVKVDRKIDVMRTEK